MLPNKLSFALSASVLLNCACVALVGEAASVRGRMHPPRSAASLHPAALQMAAAGSAALAGPEDTTAAGNPDGGSAASGGASSRRGSGLGSEEGAAASADPRRAGRPAGSRRTASRSGRAEAGQGKREAKEIKREALAQARLERRLDSGKPLSPAQQQILARLRRQQTAARVQTAAAKQTGAAGMNGKQMASVRGTGSTTDPALNRQISLMTQPSAPTRSSRAGSPGSSISPKPITYPKMKVDLGTIHLTRPKSGVTGGGSSDQRQVSIKVHYVVDDPNNVPKTLKPDRIIKRFATNCKGDPGNTSRCLPTGGNTRLGGTTLHGKHDQITGVKYCVPGSGGLPSTPGSSSSRSRPGGSPGKTWPGSNGGQKEYGPLAGSSQRISADNQNLGPANPVVLNGNHGGHLNPNEYIAPTVHESHLPDKPSDYRGLVPGAAVPIQDRKWVADPQAHLASASPGPQAVPLPRFRVSPRSIGSLSRFGTVNWGRPVKTPRPKQPLGGDGTGLLGSYYRGNNFQQLLFTRPDRNVDFDWSAAPPDPRFGRTEEYTVRWLGKLAPKVTDTYTLMASSDDGVRVYLDGKLVLSNWSVHGPSEDVAAAVSLEAGRKYDIKVEYFENGYGVAEMRLYWGSTHAPREYIPEQCLYYPK